LISVVAKFTSNPLLIPNCTLFKKYWNFCN
jgi:hypothetical protein